jgi:hypothetical protein
MIQQLFRSDASCHKTAKTAQLLVHLQQDLPTLLGDNLVGVYLHGSYVLKSYHENVRTLITLLWSKNR